ncbi:hypothetical protein LWF01_11190 [Saxibacter everestensis]|uniref:Glycerophosphoryl diester phosphodiesterase membrane domain-containing protein n=1 Tax=Saxibacter everestensis TaxID=2909229 RepID=A0ABY8QQN7_9MICO|nr:hypothetical protein LWF01_11190 [Brevibacteriaceae bacterium ZFBP1038]
MTTPPHHDPRPQPQYGQYTPQEQDAPQPNPSGQPTPQGQPAPQGHGSQPTPQGQPAPQGHGSQPAPQQQVRPQPQYGQYAPQGQGSPQGQPTPQSQGSQPAAPQQQGAPQPNPWGQSGSWEQPARWGAPQNQGQTPGAASGSGYRPAPKPGLVPLRPLKLGEILDGGFQAIRKNPKLMLGLPTIVLGITLLIGAGITVGFVALFGSQLANSPLTDEAELGVSVLFQAVSVVSGIVISFGTQLVSGFLVLYISRAVLGESLTISEVWQKLKPRVWALLGLLLLLTAAALLSGAILAAPVVLLAVAGSGVAAAVIGVLLGLLWLLALMFFGIRFALSACCLVLENVGIIVSLRRSWQLTARGFWRFTGIFLLCYLLISIVVSIITTPLTFVGSIFVGVISFAVGDNEAALIVIVVIAVILYAAVTIVASALQASYLAATTSLLYLDQRMRLEGLDVQLLEEADLIARRSPEQ